MCGQGSWGSSLRRSGAIFVTLLAVLLVLPFGVPDASGHVREALKRSPCPLVGRDYAAKFASFPKIRAAPTDGTLAFGPSALRFSESTDAVLVPGNRGGSQVSTWFEASSGVALPEALNWRITTSLTKVSSAGVDRQMVATESVTVHRPTPKALERASAAFFVSAQPSFYRLETVFRTLGGDLLGRFGRYYRVVRPQTEVVLRVWPDAAAAGQTISFGVENLGTREIALGEQFLVEKHMGLPDEWVPAIVPSTSATRRLGRLGPGAVGECQQIELPGDLSAGAYRVSKRISVQGGGSMRPIYARFSVSP